MDGKKTKTMTYEKYKNEQERQTARKESQNAQVIEKVLPLYQAKRKLNKKIRKAEEQRQRINSFSEDYKTRHKSDIEKVLRMLQKTIESAEREKFFYNSQILELGVSMTNNVVNRVMDNRKLDTDVNEEDMIGIKMIKNAINGLNKNYKMDEANRSGYAENASRRSVIPRMGGQKRNRNNFNSNSGNEITSKRRLNITTKSLAPANFGYNSLNENTSQTHNRNQQTTARNNVAKKANVHNELSNDEMDRPKTRYNDWEMCLEYLKKFKGFRNYFDGNNGSVSIDNEVIFPPDFEILPISRIYNYDDLDMVLPPLPEGLKELDLNSFNGTLPPLPESLKLIKIPKKGIDDRSYLKLGIEFFD